MATYYVYFTEQCKADAAKHGVTNDIEDFVKKRERDQNTQGLERFPPPYLKKCMGKRGRLVIEEYRNNDDIVLCLVRYFIRGSSDYDDFHKNTSSYYEKNKVSEEEVNKFLEEIKKAPIVRKKSLSDSESAYLQAISTYPDLGDGTYWRATIGLNAPLRTGLRSLWCVTTS